MSTNENFMGALFRNEAQALAFRSLRADILEMSAKKKLSKDQILDLLDKLEREANNRLEPIRKYLEK